MWIVPLLISNGRTRCRFTNAAGRVRTASGETFTRAKIPTRLPEPFCSAAVSPLPGISPPLPRESGVEWLIDRPGRLLNECHQRVVTAATIKSYRLLFKAYTGRQTKPEIIHKNGP